MIRFAICDDEPFMAEELSSLLSAYMDEKTNISYAISRFPDGPALLAGGSVFDLIFLDIQMAPPDGMETARQLRRNGCRSLLIFVTVLQERVFDAFDVDASGYLVKPLDPRRFRQTMDHAMEKLEHQPEQSLLVRRGNACEKIPLSEIVYCEVLGRKIYLHCTGGTVIDYYDRLERLEKLLEGRFFKCHRSYLVNLDHVRGCRDGQVLLPHGAAIPVSRLREQNFRQTLLRHMQRRVF